MTDKDLQMHFRQNIIKFQTKIEEKNLKEIHNIEQVEKGNKLLRYNERLYLNREGYQPWAKSVTRDKRENLVEGKMYGRGNGPKIGSGPPLAHYQPSYTAVYKKTK